MNSPGGRRIAQDCGKVDPDCTAAAQVTDLIKHQAKRVSSSNVQDFLRADRTAAESYEAYESEISKGYKYGGPIFWQCGCCHLDNAIQKEALRLCVFRRLSLMR